MPYPVIDELELKLSAGIGVAIILEGDSFDQDPAYYRVWFGNRAREVTFFPQDGWRQVVRAVGELRHRQAAVPVYGIIDRDFADDTQLDVHFESSGVLRTPRYTLENYLLDARCWTQVFEAIFIRFPDEIQGWHDVISVQRRIDQAYQSPACIISTAHNWIVWNVSEKFSTQFSASPRSYLDHPRAASDPTRLLSTLKDWGRYLDIPEDLGEKFTQKREELERMPISELQKHVSG